jgi:beta-N-acetylhexosaminidase
MSNYTNGMSLEEQIGQTLMVGFWGNTPSEEIIDLIQRYHVGNIILFSRNIHDTEQIRALTERLQLIAKEAGHRYPLLIAIDHENGIVQRLGDVVTLFPGNMALGATNSEEIAYKVALATGHELQALGINMNLAPVIDVNNNPSNPVIGVRSFGEDAYQVARLGAAMMKGYQAAGIVSCLKHFPGHGDTAIDSHLALPTIPYSLERLEELELVPFRKGIEAGAECMMIAHISFPALTKQDILPASISPAIVQALLREELGFKEVILSDCMEMNAIVKTSGTEQAAVMALGAGVDIVLVSHNYIRQRASIEAILNAVQKQELSIQVIQQAAERVLRLKATYLSRNDVPNSKTAINPITMPGIGCEAHLQLQKQAYELSTTLVRNEDGLLPLHLGPGGRIVITALHRNGKTAVEDRYHSDDMLAEIMGQYHTPVKLLSLVPDSGGKALDELLQTTCEADVFIVATVNAHLDEPQAELVRALLSSKRRVVGIAVGSPYDLLMFPQLCTYLVTYEYTRPALMAAVHVLFGEKEPLGHLPVSIPGLYPKVSSQT